MRLEQKFRKVKCETADIVPFFVILSVRVEMLLRIKLRYLRYYPYGEM